MDYLTVRSLINKLEDLATEYGDKARVGFAFPSGDYWRTVCVDEVYNVSMQKVEYSDYHQRFTLVDENKRDDEDNKYLDMLVIE